MDIETTERNLNRLLNYFNSRKTLLKRLASKYYRREIPLVFEPTKFCIKSKRLAVLLINDDVYLLLQGFPHIRPFFLLSIEFGKWEFMDIPEEDEDGNYKFSTGLLTKAAK